MKHPRLFPPLGFLAFLVMAPLLAAVDSARAADPVFPPGARVGMTPLVGLVPSKAFTGFETEDRSVKVLIAELPAAAYGEVMNTFKTNPAIAAGVKPESLETSAGTAYYTAETAKNASGVFRHYSMILSGGAFSGYVDVQVPENATKIYSDDAVRQMFASAVVRKEVPVDEQLALMPFKVGNLGDFKHVRALGATGALPMIRIEPPPPKRSHCTSVTGVSSRPEVASIRVSYPAIPSMRTGSDIVIFPVCMPGMARAA